MKTHLASAPAAHDHPPQHDHAPATHPVRRVGLLDRAALRLGVALIRWGRRPTRPARRERARYSPEALDARRLAEQLRAEHETQLNIRFR
jgi:hypothetical protein